MKRSIIRCVMIICFMVLLCFMVTFSHFYNLEVVRLMSCELDIHSLSFLEEYSKLRVLEIGEVDLDDLKGIDKLIGLEKLSIWSN